MKELLNGSMTFIILNLLKSEDMYGYQMTKKLEEISENTFTLKEGTLYPILHTLEKEKLAESYFNSDSGRKRKYYRLTDEGQKILDKKSQEWDLFSNMVKRVMAIRKSIDSNSAEGGANIEIG